MKKLNPTELSRLIARAGKVRRKNPHMRYGQILFNLLYEINPGLADHIRGTEDDPFYRDGRISSFYTAISEDR